MVRDEKRLERELEYKPISLSRLKRILTLGVAIETRLEALMGAELSTVLSRKNRRFHPIVEMLIQRFCHYPFLRTFSVYMFHYAAGDRRE